MLSGAASILWHSTADRWLFSDGRARRPVHEGHSKAKLHSTSTAPLTSCQVPPARLHIKRHALVGAAAGPLHGVHHTCTEGHVCGGRSAGGRLAPSQPRSQLRHHTRGDLQGQHSVTPPAVLSISLQLRTRAIAHIPAADGAVLPCAGVQEVAISREAELQRARQTSQRWRGKQPQGITPAAAHRVDPAQPATVPCCSHAACLGSTMHPCTTGAGRQHMGTA